jgi:SAM-dependent methyltransferase
MKDWIAFWDSKHAIYVNAHHRDVHYLRIAEDISRYIPKNGVVLDYGCGEALHADMPAAVAQRLILCEAAPKVREALAARFAGNEKIEVVTPEQVGAMGDRSLDLIILHSVVQYLSEEEFSDLLMLFHALLKPDGLLVVGDVIPPLVPASTDAFALLGFAREEGFFFAALLGLVRTYFSSYWRLRSRLGLKRYDTNDMLAKLTGAGFWATKAERNIGHNQARRTYLGRLSPVHD